MKSYRPMFIFDQQSKAVGNGERYATRAEAWYSATARFAVWTMPSDFTVETSDDPVNYRWDSATGDRVSIPVFTTLP